VEDVFEGEMHPGRLEYAVCEESASFYRIGFTPFTQLVLTKLADETNRLQFSQAIHGEHSTKADAEPVLGLDLLIRYFSEVIRPLMRLKPPEIDISLEFLIRYYLEILTNGYLLHSRRGRKLSPDEVNDKQLIGDTSGNISGDLYTEDYRFRSVVNPEYLITNTYGFSTGIPGLDYLLQGKLLVPVEGGSLLIAGPPGTGKSTIAALLAFEVALLGGVSIYAAVETDADIGLRSVSQFRTNETLLVPIVNKPDGVEKKTNFPVSGVMLYPEAIDARTAESFLETLKDYMVKTDNALNQERINRRLLVVDALNAVEAGRGKGAARGLLRDILVLAKQHQCSTLFVVERDFPYTESDQHELFVVDLVLQTHKGDVQGHPDVALIKSRYQPSWQEKGPLAFEAFRGPQVFPPLSCVSYAHRYRGSTRKFKKAPYWVSSKTFLSWQELMSPRWWSGPCVTALIGPHGSLKTNLLNAISRPVRLQTLRRKQRKAIIFLALGHESLPSEPQEANSKYESSFFEYGLRFDNLQDEAHDIRVFLVVTLRHAKPEQIIWSVLDVIDELKKLDTYPELFVLNDLSSLGSDFKMVGSQSDLLCTFVDISRAYNADTVVACSTTSGVGQESTVGQLENLADNIIILAGARHSGKSVYTLQIKRSMTGKHPDSVFEVIVDEEGGCSIGSPLRMVNAVTANHLELIQADVTMYAETQLQRRYAERARSTYRIQYDRTISIEVTGINQIDWSLSRFHVMPREKLRIVQVDGFQVELESEGAEPEKLPYFDVSSLWTRYDLREMFRPGTVKGKRVFSVPFFLNPSFLIIPRDYGFDNYDPGDLTKGWEWLFKTGVEAKAAMGKDKTGEISIFAAPLVSSENYNALFLEIFEYYLLKVHSVSLNEEQFGSLGPIFDEYAEEVFHAVVMVCQLLAGTNFRDEGPSEDGTIRLSENTLFYRTWYSIGRQLLEDLSSQSEWRGKHRCTFLPGKVSLQGSWHLAIPNGSASPEEGIEFIKDLCNEDAAWERLRFGVGLPPHRIFYEDARMKSYALPATGLTFSDIDKMDTYGLDRSKFKDYHAVAPRLAFLIRQLAQMWRRYGLRADKFYEFESKEVKQFREEIYKSSIGFEQLFSGRHDQQ
jgi:KaiC/GvpD/RAD55 family RecA-like ATPase